MLTQGISKSIRLERLFDANGQRTGLYRAEFEDKTGSFLTACMKLKEVQDDINHYLSSLGYNFKYKFHVGKNYLNTKEVSL